MQGSPLAFLRGAAPLFYEVLAARKDLAAGPPGEGWIVGDMHLENFGAYRPDPLGGPDTHVAFNLNDFDDAVIGPWRWDALRLTTSLLLGGREIGFDGHAAIDLCHQLLDGYVASAFHGRRLPAAPPPVLALLKQVRERSRKELLDLRTVVRKGKRSFARGPRYAPLARSVLARVPGAFARYVEGLPQDERPDEDHLRLLDAAHRIAGTGSLGALRVAVLVSGKGGADGAWIFDMKEQDEPSAAALVKTPQCRPAERVLRAAQAMLEHPPLMMGTSLLSGASLLVKRLSPQDDKLNLRRLRAEDLAPLSRYVGALLGAAHARGATKKARAWNKSDVDELVDRAIELAGIHEAVYLASCKLWG
jgi:uncharacterized protein (DUF2252 family)